MKTHLSKRVLSVVFPLILPALVLGDCTCDNSSDFVDKHEALKYKAIAIVTILLGGAAGVFIPMFGKVIPALRPEKDIFFIIKAFAAGVILATGFVHVLPDAFAKLTSPCLNANPWANFPFAGFAAMVTAMGTLMVDASATSYFNKRHFDKVNELPANRRDHEEEEHERHVHVHTHASHGHSHGSLLTADSGSAKILVRQRVTAQVLELGIVVHSVIIGISLGASQSPSVIKPLVAALTFHQFFEGMGLGGCISQAKLEALSIAFMATFFTLTTPVGIAIGIGISSSYNDNSTIALIVEGIFNGASAGILIYMALVDLLAPDFMSAKMQGSGILQVTSNASLLAGAGLMSLLAKWA